MRTITLTTAVLVLAPSISIAQQSATANPENNTLYTGHGPTTKLVNGSILEGALVALNAAELLRSPLESNDLMWIGTDGLTFELLSGFPNIRFLVKGNSATPLSGAQVMSPALTMSLGELRAIRTAQKRFDSRVDIPANSTRQLRDYDILIFSRADKRYFVGYSHHLPPGTLTTWAGCFDGSGYNGEYIVDSSNFSAIVKEIC